MDLLKKAIKEQRERERKRKEHQNHRREAEELAKTNKNELIWMVQRLRSMIKQYEKDWIMIRFFKCGRKPLWRKLWGGFEVGPTVSPTRGWRRFGWHSWRRWAFGFRGQPGLTLDMGPLSFCFKRKKA